ncbi:uncharacterized protein LAJ45_08440 [Morchella importuna]|uniref:uncharacterized protein n=1 Tax=Morchella importuna TaxID=1174673 RepID=UPI001E8EA86A|nr:uncharacterized protein LAJ45_08440 [Morchella importuna]KAH8147612.1 hypothetical protein LAJ45_08440 [Morchella importuna]
MECHIGTSHPPLIRGLIDVMFCQQHVYSNLSTAAPDAPVEAILALSSINDYSQAVSDPELEEYRRLSALGTATSWLEKITKKSGGNVTIDYCTALLT